MEYLWIMDSQERETRKFRAMIEIMVRHPGLPEIYVEAGLHALEPGTAFATGSPTWRLLMHGFKRSGQIDDKGFWVAPPGDWDEPDSFRCRRQQGANHTDGDVQDMLDALHEMQQED